MLVIFVAIQQTQIDPNKVLTKPDARLLGNDVFRRGCSKIHILMERQQGKFTLQPSRWHLHHHVTPDEKQ